VSWQSFRTRSLGTGGRLALAAALAAVGGSGFLVGRAIAPAPALASPAAQNMTVQIYSDHLDPQQVTLEALSTVSLDVVNNTAQDCTFYIEGYVTDWLVPAQGSVQNDFDVPDLPPRSDDLRGDPTGGPSDSGSVVVPMGCRGMTAQQGTAIVQRQPGT